jgi:adenine/guanine phosphoribosyltransferase-like PRPP-binding protein
VLVIDDVVTTGSTLRAAGHALDLAGATKVVLFAAAATPDEIASGSWKKAPKKEGTTNLQVA